MIVCLRTVESPPRCASATWPGSRRAARSARRTASWPSWCCEPTAGDGRHGGDHRVADHEIFDAWIATPERDALTASEVHQAVDYRPITRYDVVGGYLNLAGLPKGAAMKWVTRARPKTDRIACPWLIRRFIDPDAEILYVPADEVLAGGRARRRAHLRRARRRYTHRDGRCTFEVLIDDYDLGDPALHRLAADRARRRHRRGPRHRPAVARACSPSPRARRRGRRPRLLERGAVRLRRPLRLVPQQVAAR